ncbi:MAG: MMPL family transporter, partial [Ilumatobacteraceae bacterium]
MLHSFGLIAHARRRVVVAVWVAVLLALGAGVGSIGSSFSTQFTLPDVESAEGFELLSERFGGEESGRSATIVVQANGGFTAA